MTTDPRLVSLVASKAVRDALNDADNALRAEVAAELRPSERRPVYVELNGEEVMVGAVTMSKPGAGRRVARVTDERRFLLWVMAMRPDALVNSVADWARKELLDGSIAGAEFADPQTGELIEAPWGVEISEVPGSSPRMSVRPEAENAHALVRAVMAGQVGALRLEGGA